MRAASVDIDALQTLARCLIRGHNVCGSPREPPMDTINRQVRMTANISALPGGVTAVSAREENVA